jgi:hypothetical protein
MHTILSFNERNNHMDQRPKGNFIANPVRYQTGNRPAYRGKIHIPGTERAFEVALWSSKYPNKDTGELTNIVLNGHTSDVSTSDSAMEQIDAIASRGAIDSVIEHKGMSLKAGQIAVFTNGYKTEPGVDPDQLAKRPDFHGYWNPGHGEKLVQVSVWARSGKDGGAFISGATQYPLPGKEAGKEEVAERDLQDLVEAGDVTKGMPAKGRRKADQREGASR